MKANCYKDDAAEIVRIVVKVFHLADVSTGRSHEAYARDDDRQGSRVAFRRCESFLRSRIFIFQRSHIDIWEVEAIYSENETRKKGIG
jgi:hypothetical protein